MAKKKKAVATPETPGKPQGPQPSEKAKAPVEEPKFVRGLSHKYITGKNQPPYYIQGGNVFDVKEKFVDTLENLQKKAGK